LGQEALINNTTASNNTAVGYQSSYFNTTGANNATLGSSAGKNNTTGQHNTSIGQSAGRATNEGSYNVAVGSEALRTNTTASNNTAVGYQALYANTTGADNTAVGYTALSANSTGLQNTAVGHQALSANTTGNNAVAVGRTALANNTTGERNHAFGLGALGNNTTGQYNSALGFLALNQNTTGGYNTAVGYQAGYSNQTTGANVFVGENAGYFSTNQHNTFLGAGAGYFVTSGQKNTILGRYNGNQHGLDIRTSNNNIVLADGDGNPRMYYNSNSWTAVSARADWGYAMSNYVASGDGLIIGINENASTRNFIGMYSANAGRYNAFIRSDGDYESYNNSYGGISDAKLKENVVDAPSQWNDLKAVQVRKYSLISDGLEQGNQLGVVAQELEASGMSGLVKEAPDRDVDGNDLGTTTKSVKYSILYMKAVKALQEAMDRIETLEAKVTALENA
jgi:hypothetical protein